MGQSEYIRRILQRGGQRDNPSSSSITTETQAAFFDAIVKRLHNTKVHVRTDDEGRATIHIVKPGEDAPAGAKGLLETFDTPLGTHREDCPENSKVLHTFLNDKDLPGTVFHLGDEPYWRLTRNRVQEEGFTQEDIDLKVRSIRLAIDQYMPTECFNEYLIFFRENLHLPSHKQAINNSLQEMQEQITDPNSTEVPIDYIEQLMAKVHQTGADKLREKLSCIPETNTLAEHPDLVLAMAIFHAAHNTYISQLYQAVCRARGEDKISLEEFDNASFTLESHSFRQFNHFLLFATMAPLIMMEYAKTGDITADDKPRKKEAIGAAWGKFFETNLLTRRFDNNNSSSAQERPDEARRSVTCPALKHLVEAKKTGALEDTYDYVCANLLESQIIGQAQSAMNDIVLGRTILS